MPPLLLKLSEKRPVRLHYLGVSYGLTPSLHKFWKRAGFVPLYLRQTPNDLTGEHTCVMLKALKSEDLVTTCDPEWLAAFSKDFHKRFLNLLSYQFRGFPSVLSLSIMEAADAGSESAKNRMQCKYHIYKYIFILLKFCNDTHFKSFLKCILSI